MQSCIIIPSFEAPHMVNLNLIDHLDFLKLMGRLVRTKTCRLLVAADRLSQRHAPAVELAASDP